MGCHVMFLQDLVDRGCWPRGARVLDFGTQRLLGEPDAIRSFADSVAAPGFAEGTEAQRQLDALLTRFAQDPERHPLDLADVLLAVGVEYVAFDVCPGTATRRFDLNADELPPDDRNAFDVVLNFGTTEHLLGQDHAFRVAHEAVKPGGVMCHQLPCVGYLGHGYFSYHPLLFRDLAQVNGYEIIALWLTGPQGPPDRALLEQFEDEPDLTPSNRADCDVEGWQQLTQRDGVLNAILRKPTDTPYRRPLEVRTASQHAFETRTTDHALEQSSAGLSESVPIYLTADRDLTKVPLRRLVRELWRRVKRKALRPNRPSTES